MQTSRFKKIIREGSFAGSDVAFIDMAHNSFDPCDAQRMVMAAERVAVRVRSGVVVAADKIARAQAAQMRKPLVVRRRHVSARLVGAPPLEACRRAGKPCFCKRLG